jgi:hypothetical protein
MHFGDDTVDDECVMKFKKEARCPLLMGLHVTQVTKFLCDPRFESKRKPAS